MSDRHYNVLFLSNRNAARSIFAEAAMNRIGCERSTGFSAGIRPKEQLDPLVCDILRMAQYPTDGLHPKHWKQFAEADAPPSRFCIHVGRSGGGPASATLARSTSYRGLAISGPGSAVRIGNGVERLRELGQGVAAG